MYGQLWNLHWVASFDTIVLAIAYYESTCNICLVVTKSLASNYWQFMQTT